MSQHQVSPFEVLDPAVPARRKILAFFVVNPSHRILSTLHVPPQQRDWVQWGVVLPLARLLSPRARKLVWDFLGVTLTLGQAKLHRGTLMEERTRVSHAINETLFELECSLCEH
jgi:hypothetical protein